MSSPSLSQNKRNVKWVEGLRGITSVLVIVTHMARAWDFALFWPSDSIDASPRFWQLPIVRIPFQGRIGVPIFAFLTGFVCAYKPLKLAYQQGNAPAALQSVARSAFRRPPRLVLPAVIATFISFVLTCLGAYKTATRVDSFWVRFDAPDPVASFGEEVHRLFHTTLTTWTTTENIYDRHQWAMRPLLIGAFQVYVVLAATIGMRFKYRILVHLLLLSYWLLNTAPMTETFGANLALGTLLAELSLHRPTQDFLASRARLFSYVFAPLILLTGLFVGGYPHEHEDWQPWSWWLHDAFVDPAGDGTRGSFVVPLGSDPPRRFSSFCIQMCAVAVFLSPPMREALSHRLLLWLGRHSFAVYLVHGTILRTVGTWIVYGVTGEPWAPAGKNPDGTDVEQEWLHPISAHRKKVAVVVFVALTYVAAWAWMRWVDTACARATQWLENRVFEDEDSAALAEKGYSNPSVLMNGHGALHVESKVVLSPTGEPKMALV